MNFLMSSSHLILGLACLRFRCSGNHSVTVRVHRSSFILATCPAHCHFSCFYPYNYILYSSLLSYPFICFTISSGYSNHSSFHASLSCFQPILHSFRYSPILASICHCSLYALIIHFCLQPYWYVTFHYFSVLSKCSAICGDSSFGFIRFIIFHCD